MNYRFTEEQMQQRELRAAAFHEAGHRTLYRHFGGDGTATVWKNPHHTPAECAWFGQFRVRVCPARAHEKYKNSGIQVPDLPENWEVLCGMAGLLAEQIQVGKAARIDVTRWPVEIIKNSLELRIRRGDVSETDLQVMAVIDNVSCRLKLEDVSETWQILLRNWAYVEEEAALLMDEAISGCAAPVGPDGD